jgi:hypothetical protein
LKKDAQNYYLMYILTDYYRLILTNDRPDLSSEGAPHRVKTAILIKQI